MERKKYSGENKYGVEKIKEAHLTKDRLTEMLGREPTIHEISVEMDYPEKDVIGLLKLRIEEESENEDSDFELRFRMSVKNHELEKVRFARNLMQKEVAEAVGIGIASYCQIETCRLFPNEQLQKKIADFFNIEKEKLFPEFLKAFSQKWNKTEKSRVVPISTISIASRDALMLPSGDYEEMIRSADNAVMAEKIRKVLDQMPNKERMIIEMRFGLLDGKDKDLGAVGQKFGVTRERVRQIEAKALERIRQSDTFKAIKKAKIYED